MHPEPDIPSSSQSMRAVPSTQELVQLAYRYHPLFDPTREKLHEFRDRAPLSPELQELYDMVAKQLTDNHQWHALLADVQAQYPDYWLADGRPPVVDIPSYQLVLAYQPPGSIHSRYLSFRLSMLAPVFDFYETERASDHRIIARHPQPTPESAAVAEAIAAAIARHFGYNWLSPEVGATPLPGLWVDGHDPGDATLTDALFEGARRW